MELKIEAVLLSGESNVNEALQACLVKRIAVYFKRSACAPSRNTLERSQGFIWRSVQES